MNNTMFIILSLLFIVLGSFFIHKMIGCGGSTAQFLVVDGSDFKTTPADAFSFNLNSATLNSNDDLNKAFKKVATYLKNLVVNVIS